VALAASGEIEGSVIDDMRPVRPGQAGSGECRRQPKHRLPVGFIVPAQRVEQDRPPTGERWVHEIKHDGYRLMVRKDGLTARLFTRKGNDG
jgi:ATP-dependent DNA ligase